jgi:cell division protease FtsH
MFDSELTPERFGVVFKSFVDAVVAEATTAHSPLLERIQRHLGADPTQLPVIAEEFDSFEQPNVQVALDEYVGGSTQPAELVGVAADNKRFMALGLSDLLSRGSTFGRPMLQEGPVDYVNFHLADDRVLAAVQFGLYLLTDGEAPLVAFVAGPSNNMGPRLKVRVEVMSPSRETAEAFLAALIDGMQRLNVYRGHVISLSPGEMGPGPQTLVAFHALPHVERDAVVLPDGLLERVERHTVVFAEHAERLLAAGAR